MSRNIPLMCQDINVRLEGDDNISCLETLRSHDLRSFKMCIKELWMRGGAKTEGLHVKQWQKLLSQASGLVKPCKKNILWQEIIFSQGAWPSWDPLHIVWWCVLRMTWNHGCIACGCWICQFVGANFWKLGDTWSYWRRRWGWDDINLVLLLSRGFSEGGSEKQSRLYSETDKVSHQLAWKLSSWWICHLDFME